MLLELHVSQLGVVEDLALVFGDGMTAVTGETGAGKTLIVEAIRLLTGGRAEPHAVRTGATEARIEGRFLVGDEEQVLTRVIPKDGRSRAYVNGEMVPVARLGEIGERLVDLHGQHASQALLSPSAQRVALDGFGNVDLTALREAKAAIAAIGAELESLGGDVQTRAREIDLLRFQIEELDAAEVNDDQEDDRLKDEAELLADAAGHREAAVQLHAALTQDRGVVEGLGAAIRAAHGRGPLADIAKRLQVLSAEVDDLSAEAAGLVDQLVDDPERLQWVQERRQGLKQLERKYGSTLTEVIAYRDETRKRLVDLERHDERVGELEALREQAMKRLVKAQQAVRNARVEAAPVLAKEVELRLRGLALPHARFAVEVGTEGAGDDVQFLLGPNPGMPLLPVAKAASGGELARSMLALRLSVLVHGSQDQDVPPTLVFDEVDAGIGGEAAIAVGGALADLAKTANAQVFVVTHLPQVAAFANHQVTVSKQQNKDSTVAQVQLLDLTQREVELARMLSGRPDSDSGRAHARELLEQATGNGKKKKKSKIG